MIPISSILAEATTQSLLLNSAPAKISFAFLSLETPDESCWCFIQGSVRKVCQRSAIRHRVRPKSLRRCGHSRQQNDSECSGDHTVYRQRPPRLMLCSCSPLSTADCADWTPLPFFRGRIWSLGGRPMQQLRSLPTTQPRARAGSRLQPTPTAALTDQLHHPVPSRLMCHSGSSSLRVGSAPGSSHCGNGCACSGEVSGAKDAVEQAVFVKAASFCRPPGLVCKCHGKEGGAGQETLSAASQEGSLECRAATCPGSREEDNDETAADVVSFQPRFQVQELIFTHRPYQSWLRLSGNFLCKIDRLSVRGTAQPERTILPTLEVLTSSKCCSSGQSSSGEWSSARWCLPARS